MNGDPPGFLSIAWRLAVPVLAVAAAAAAAWLVNHRDATRVSAIIFAAGVCLAGSMAAGCAGLVAGSTPSGRVASSLAAVTLRLLPALAALGWLQTSGGEIQRAGGGPLLLAFYLAALAADLLRIIMGSSRGGRGRGGEPI